MASSNGTSAVATAKDAGIKTLKDLKGKRVAFVKGAASLQNSMRGMLAFAGLTWDDVVKVEVPGYAASIQAVIDGNADAAYGTTHSAPFLKIDASPRGLHFPPVPHNDEEGWRRLKEVLPFFFKAIATEGPALPPGGQEMASAAYPVLVTTPATSEDHNYNLTKAMVAFYDEYKGSAPGANGWAVERQRFADTLLPFNAGSIRYFKEIGVWTAEAQATHEGNLKRQALLRDVWARYVAKAPEDETAFKQGWMQVRAEALKQAGLPVIQESWDLSS
jgi:TRAP transporter TAXI family solute receptor